MAGLPTNSTSIGNRPAIFLTRHCSRHHRPNQTRPSPVDANIFIIPTLNMKIFYTMLGAVVLAGSAAAFTRQSAPSIIRRSTTIAMASPIDFAKSEIASNDVSRARQAVPEQYYSQKVTSDQLLQGLSCPILFSSGNFSSSSIDFTSWKVCAGRRALAQQPYFRPGSELACHCSIFPNKVPQILHCCFHRVNIINFLRCEIAKQK